jgi:hypothetical protein
MARRIGVALLAVALVLGTVSSAFALGYSDVTGTKYQDPVNVLSSLGILKGFPDGTFKPGATITRAQFAAVGSRALGLEMAAQQAAGPTKFPDVPATHWASGYINVCTDQGILKGFPNGTFHPEEPVTYVQSLAILVRVLGYDPMVKGTWPTNYAVKAAEIGLSKGVTFAANNPAPRGDVALFTENALDIGMLEQVTAGDIVQYVVTGETLLDRLGFRSETGTVEETADVFGSGLDADEAAIDGDVYELATGTSMGDQLGLEIEYWMDDDDHIVFAKTLTKASDIISGEIEHITADGDKVEINDKTYKSPGWFTCLWNMAEFDSDAIVADDARFEGADATLVLEDGDIAFMRAVQFDGSAIIADVNAKYERFDVWDETGGEVRFNADDYQAARFVKGGEEIELADLAELDVSHYFEITAGGDDYLYVELVADKKSGEVDEVSVDRDDNILVTVDREDYTLAADATMSTDDNGTIDAATEAGMEDFVGNDATIYLNRDGDVRHVVGDFDVAASELAGVVKTAFYKIAAVEPGDDDRFFVKVFKTNGATTRYEFTDDTTFAALEDVNVGDLVLDSDGYASDAGLSDLNDELEAGSYIELTLDKDGLLASVDEIEFDDDSVSLNLDESDIDADHNLVFDWRGTAGTMIVDTGEWEVLPWASFEQMTIDSGPVNGLNLDHGGDATAETIIFDSTGHDVDYGAQTADTGVVLGRRVTSEGTAVKILVEGETTSYLVAGTTPDALSDGNEGADTNNVSDIDVGDVVEFTADADELTELTELLANKYGGLRAYWVDDVNEGDLIVTVRDDEDPDLATLYDLLLEEDVVVYDVTGTPVEGELGDVATDQVVQAIDTDGDDLIEILKIVE